MKIPEMPDKRKIGAEIKRICDDKSISVQNLSNAIGKTKTTVRNIFQGEASYDLLKKTLTILKKWEQKKI